MAGVGVEGGVRCMYMYMYMYMYVYVYVYLVRKVSLCSDSKITYNIFNTIAMMKNLPHTNVPRFTLRYTNLKILQLRTVVKNTHKYFVILLAKSCVFPARPFPKCYLFSVKRFYHVVECQIAPLLQK